MTPRGRVGAATGAGSGGGRHTSHTARRLAGENGAPTSSVNAAMFHRAPGEAGTGGRRGRRCTGGDPR